tara:strand:- start:7213 stop:9942 length:2730 start_codon:yes stop_codon:yes gene_type:complete
MSLASLICPTCGGMGIVDGHDECMLCGGNVKLVKKGLKQHAAVTTTIDEGDLEEQNIDLFETYEPFKSMEIAVAPGSLPKHPCKISESAVLGAVKPPMLGKVSDYITNAKLFEGGLSDIQIETLCYIVRRLLSTLDYNGVIKNNGFFLGDGTGCGKGRCVAGTISEFFSRGHNKHVWVSVSNDLYYDAVRDLKDIGEDIPITQVADLKDGFEGIVFITYSSFVSSKRHEALMNWCGSDFDGVIAFDESHKGKNISSSSMAEKMSTQTALKMVEIQREYNNAKFLYVSATGCSEVRHIGYMERLGLWGTVDSPFKTFDELYKNLHKGGALSQEIMAMELKTTGAFIARQLSYKKVTSKVTKIEIGHRIEIYDRASSMWKGMYSDIAAASGDKLAYMLYWGFVLRFFRSMIVGFKINKLKDMIEDALAADYSVIISLQGTGEAHMDVAKELGENIDSPKIIALKYLKMAKNKYCNDEDHSLESVIDFYVEKFKNEDFDCPNPLDEILSEFGEEEVAEITGRKERMINGQLCRKTQTTMQEKNAFLNGDKRIAMLSEVGSVGISLQTDPRFKNQQRRFHIILELPWSAEQFVQQCGRSHRSNQVNAPHYEILVTDVPGEMRFTSTIMKRLQSLGALTAGNRFTRCSEFDTDMDFDSKNGEKAISKMMSLMDAEINQYVCPVKYKNCTSRTFFNRLMSFPVKVQKKIFDRLDREYVLICSMNSRNRSIDNGINDIKASFANKTDDTVKLKEGMNLVKIEAGQEAKTIDYIDKMSSKKKGMFYIEKESGIPAWGYVMRRGSDTVTMYRADRVSEINVLDCIVEEKYEEVINKDAIESLRVKWVSVNLEHEKNSMGDRNIYMITGRIFKGWNKMFRHLNMIPKVKRIKLSDGSREIGFHVPESSVDTIKQIMQSN